MSTPRHRVDAVETTSRAPLSTRLPDVGRPIYDGLLRATPLTGATGATGATVRRGLYALATLTPSHRAVLYQVYFADQTYAEAAKALGIPEGTVKSRIYHALRRLRLALDEETAHGGPSTVRSAPSAMT